MAKIQIYTTTWCGYCVRAKTLLDSLGLEYEEIHLDDDAGFRATLHDLTGGWTVPLLLLVAMYASELLVSVPATRDWHAGGV